VTLTNLLAVVVALAVFAASARRVDRAKAVILLPAGLIGVLPGTALSRLLASGPLQVAVGTILVLGLAAVLLATRRARLRAGARPVSAGCAGLALGFTSAAAGAGGPALTVYAVVAGWPQPEFAATGQLCYATQCAAALAIEASPRCPAAGSPSRSRRCWPACSPGILPPAGSTVPAPAGWPSPSPGWLHWPPWSGPAVLTAE
jgi:hypothetical protein